MRSHCLHCLLISLITLLFFLALVAAAANVITILYGSVYFARRAQIHFVCSFNYTIFFFGFCFLFIASNSSTQHFHLARFVRKRMYCPDLHHIINSVRLLSTSKTEKFQLRLLVRADKKPFLQCSKWWWKRYRFLALAPPFPSSYLYTHTKKRLRANVRAPLSFSAPAHYLYSK